MTTDGDSGKPPADAGMDVAPFVQAPHTQQYPAIPNNGGAALQPLKLVTIVSAGDPLVNDLFAFSDALVASNWLKAAGADYGLSSATNVNIQSGDAITTNPTADAMDTFIGNAIASHPEAAADANTMYLLYLPDNIVDVDPRGTNTDCTLHGGYHTVGNSGRVWGFSQRCPTNGTGLSKLESLTLIASHEVMEAATDPHPETGWTFGALTKLSQSPYAATTGEVGDMCVGTEIIEGLYTYQRIWSNTAADAGGDPCVPPVKDPFYNVTTDKNWYPVTAGSSVTITPINNGASATLTVATPSTPGVAAVVSVLSFPQQALSDEYHFLPIGIYTQ
jgi:hypothetical protein